ncbi:MAG: NAD(P)H-dependent oxidoreductase subunit E, partial [Myxococcota bacterium]|nr:NAD(P)H-dependent oxidoreductase subunit E [Myxococcota bacterium]
MSVQFSADAERHIDELIGRYPERLGALIPALFIPQQEFGYLTREVFELVAARLDVPTAQVLNTATFYTMLYKKPVGQHHLQICRNVSCFLRGADALTACAHRRLGLSNGDVTQDARFSLELVECLAACGGAPVVRINETYHENVTPEAFD